MKPYIFNIVLAGLLLLPYPAQAGTVTPIHFKGIYVCTYSGIPIGKMGIDIEQTPSHYAIAADITTAGLLRLFVKHQSHSMVEASGHDFSYSHAHYETHYQTRDKRRYIRLIKSGERMEETQLPPDDHATRPVVPAGMLKNAVDPLSLIIQVREKLREKMADHQSVFSINIYDGNRLSEADFTIVGAQQIFYGQRRVPVIEVTGRRKPLAGFTKKEMGDFTTSQPTLYIYFSDDTQLMPLKLQMAMPFGLLTATLIKQCIGNESCLLGIQVPNP